MDILDIIKQKKRERFINKRYKDLGKVVINDEDITVYASLELVSDKDILLSFLVYSTLE